MKESRKKILALDFDGVLWHSAGENWEVGFLAYKKFSKTLACGEKTRKKFLKGRHLARCGEEFFYIFKLIDDNPDIDFKKITPAKWKYLKTKHKDKAAEFTEEFYKMRAHLKRKHNEKWVNSQEPYGSVLKEVKKARKYFKEIYIASAKDSNSIKLLLSKYGLKFKVFGREHSIHKHEQLTHIRKKLNINYEDIYFIDDCIENLTPLLKLGVNVFLAGWGYNSTADKKRAKKLGIPVLKINNLSKILNRRKK